MSMFDIVFNHVDVIFTAILCMLYFGNIFYVKDLLYRFLIFFSSVFLTIMVYSFIIYKQDNFVIFLLLNIVFIIEIFFLLLFSKKNERILEINLESINSKYITVISLLFCLIFFIFVYVFFGINKEDVIANKGKEILVNKTVYLDKNKDLQVNEIINANSDRIDYIYIRNVKELNGDKFLIKYNFLIISYIVLFIGMYFFNKLFKEDANSEG